MGKSTVAEIVKETCEALWDELQHTYLPAPTSVQWKNGASLYCEKWNFPNCLGSIDGKHIRIKCPSKTGSMYFNYKQFFSIVLQAVADANLKFVAIDIGAYGRESDGGIFRNSSLYQHLITNTLEIPEDTELPGTSIKMPYVFVADEAYPLLINVLRPYPGRELNEQCRIFNYRLSRARRTVECSFGLLTSKWRLLNKAIETDVENAIIVTKAICLLHNIVLTHDSSITLDNDIHCNNATGTGGRTNNAYSRAAKNVRDVFTTYFTSSAGKVPWQWDSI